MGILNIRPVKAGQGKIVIGIAGPTGCGKTLTGLYIARGMVTDPSKIGYLDTENRRGSMYAESLDGPFQIADLYPPFSPSRYATAIKEFQEAGVEVLVIDSVTHEWEGEGGCEDIADAALANGKMMADWKRAKKEHKKFMNTLLQSNLNIICCIRAREKTDFKDPKKPVSLGIQPVCEKNFMFEMTASILMENEGKTQKHIKVPNFLKPAFGDGKNYLNAETGKKIMDLMKFALPEDPEVEKAKTNLLQSVEMGMAGLSAVWNTLSKEMKVKLNDFKEVCKASAMEYDEQEKEAKEDPKETLKPNSKQATIDMP